MSGPYDLDLYLAKQYISAVWILCERDSSGESQYRISLPLPEPNLRPSPDLASSISLTHCHVKIIVNVSRSSKHHGKNHFEVAVLNICSLKQQMSEVPLIIQLLMLKSKYTLVFKTALSKIH